MRKKMKWLVESRYDKTQNCWKRRMGFETKREALEVAKEWRKSQWMFSFRVVKNP
jgi:hypothetical protein